METLHRWLGLIFFSFTKDLQIEMTDSDTLKGNSKNSSYNNGTLCRFLHKASVIIFWLYNVLMLSKQNWYVFNYLYFIFMSDRNLLTAIVLPISVRNAYISWVPSIKVPSINNGNILNYSRQDIHCRGFWRYFMSGLLRVLRSINWPMDDATGDDVTEKWRCSGGVK